MAHPGGRPTDYAPEQHLKLADVVSILQEYLKEYGDIDCKAYVEFEGKELATYKCDPGVSAYMVPTYNELLTENASLREKLAKHEPEELLPCPFCGSDVTLEVSTIVTGKFVVVCDNSNCYASYAAFNTEEIAIKAWNKRVE